jgi:hypothetical protein
MSEPKPAMFFAKQSAGAHLRDLGQPSKNMVFIGIAFSEGGINQVLKSC